MCRVVTDKTDPCCAGCQALPLGCCKPPDLVLERYGTSCMSTLWAACDTFKSLSSLVLQWSLLCWLLLLCLGVVWAVCVLFTPSIHVLWT